VRDDFGHWFGCDNNIADALSCPTITCAQSARPAPGPAVFVPAGPDPNQLYPISRIKRYNDPHTANRTTSACGIGIYRDDRLGKFYSNAFVASPSTIWFIEVLQAEWGHIQDHRAADEKNSEFLASTDNWFRPVQVRTGPDGALGSWTYARF
jgi:hypothetical protein